jgi:N utilization substance protein A
MEGLSYSTIEQISREKHVEPEVIVAAIEDAMVVAARKFYKTEEELRASTTRTPARWKCTPCAVWSKK